MQLVPLSQSELEVSAAEVEALIVQAIGRRVMEARIDQLRGVVTVAKCVPRTFGAAQWRELQQQLAVWKVRWGSRNQLGG